MTDPLPPMPEDLAHSLRAEARGLAEVLRDVLLDEAPRDSVQGVYLKGSSVRPWDSIIDYAPEVSDVDVHVRAHPDARAVTDSLDFALEVARRTEREFAARFPTPTHTPRPQLFFLHEMEQTPGYLGSTADSVIVLHGAEYSYGTADQYRDCHEDDAKRFLADADFVLDSLPGKIIDRPGRLAWQAVASLTWRVAPAGPRILTATGEDPWQMWSLHRSGLVAALVSSGHGAAAAAYRDFYLAAWDGYRDRFRSAGPALRAVEAAFRLFAEGRNVVTSSAGRAADTRVRT